MQYVTRLRVHRALALLREERLTLAAVARQVGYGSEAALSAAVKRWTGRSPGSYGRPREADQPRSPVSTG